MDYTEKYSELKAVFDPGKEEIIIPGSDICIRNVDFSSDPDLPFIINCKDFSISENRIFSYPVFTPANRESKKAIILLHGLNERSWVKYLAWAYRLAYDTGSYVILFPISFHINRSPDSWKDPRAMLDAVRERNVSAGNLKMSSFANVALSNRLTEDPLRFFRSGYQTSNDIIKLMLQIRKGEHKVVPAGSSVDIFAYSIGAFLGEIIMMGNPANLLDRKSVV